MTNITLKKHGTKCEKKKEYGFAKIKTKKGDKYEPVICKKSRQIFGRKYKSTLKKKKGTLSFGKYGKKLAHPNNNNQNSKCMNGPCWHRLSFYNKKSKDYKKSKSSINKAIKLAIITQNKSRQIPIRSTANNQLKYTLKVGNLKASIAYFENLYKKISKNVFSNNSKINQQLLIKIKIRKLKEELNKTIQDETKRLDNGKKKEGANRNNTSKSRKRENRNNKPKSQINLKDRLMNIIINLNERIIVTKRQLTNPIINNITKQMLKKKLARLQAKRDEKNKEFISKDLNNHYKGLNKETQKQKQQKQQQQQQQQQQKQQQQQQKQQQQQQKQQQQQELSSSSSLSSPPPPPPPPPLPPQLPPQLPLQQQQKQKRSLLPLQQQQKQKRSLLPRPIRHYTSNSSESNNFNLGSDTELVRPGGLALEPELELEPERPALQFNPNNLKEARGQLKTPVINPENTKAAEVDEPNMSEMIRKLEAEADEAHEKLKNLRKRKAELNKQQRSINAQKKGLGGNNKTAVMSENNRKELINLPGRIERQKKIYDDLSNELLSMKQNIQLNFSSNTVNRMLRAAQNQSLPNNGNGNNNDWSINPNNEELAN